MSHEESELSFTGGLTAAKSTGSGDGEPETTGTPSMAASPAHAPAESDLPSTLPALAAPVSELMRNVLALLQDDLHVLTANGCRLAAGSGADGRLVLALRIDGHRLSISGGALTLDGEPVTA